MHPRRQAPQKSGDRVRKVNSRRVQAQTENMLKASPQQIEPNPNFAHIPWGMSTANLLQGELPHLEDSDQAAKAYGRKIVKDYCVDKERLATLDEMDMGGRWQQDLYGMCVYGSFQTFKKAVTDILPFPIATGFGYTCTANQWRANHGIRLARERLVRFCRDLGSVLQRMGECLYHDEDEEAKEVKPCDFYIRYAALSVSKLCAESVNDAELSMHFEQVIRHSLRNYKDVSQGVMAGSASFFLMKAPSFYEMLHGRTPVAGMPATIQDGLSGPFYTALRRIQHQTHSNDRYAKMQSNQQWQVPDIFMLHNALEASYVQREQPEAVLALKAYMHMPMRVGDFERMHACHESDLPDSPLSKSGIFFILAEHPGILPDEASSGFTGEIRMYHSKPSDEEVSECSLWNPELAEELANWGFINTPWQSRVLSPNDQLEKACKEYMEYDNNFKHLLNSSEHLNALRKVYETTVRMRYSASAEAESIHLRMGHRFTTGKYLYTCSDVYDPQPVPAYRPMEKAPPMPAQ